MPFLRQKLIDLRKEKGLTRTKLAELCFVDHTIIAKLEWGKQTNPSYFTIAKISDALCVPMEYFTDYKQLYFHKGKSNKDEGFSKK